MNTDTYRRQLNELLNLEIDAAGRLDEVLAAEHLAIINHDAEALEQSIAAKQAGIDQLETLGRRRAALVESPGFGNGHADIESCLQAHDSDGSLTELWKQLLTIAGKCREDNLRNHHLVEIGSRHTRQVLRILRGEDADNNVYSASGNTDGSHDSRSLGRV